MTKFSNTARAFDAEPDYNGVGMVGGFSGPYKSCFIRRVTVADAVFDETDTDYTRFLDEDGKPLYAFECETKEQATALCALLNVSESLLHAAPQVVELVETLANYLGESHALEKDSAHYGDDEATCSYCAAIDAAREFLAGVKGETP